MRPYVEPQFDSREDTALALDAADPLRGYREQFHIPQREGRPVAYFCGNSLGLQPKATRASVEEVLDDWAKLAVDAHFDARFAWYPYHEFVRDAAARLVGALPHEVVVMNGLTVNLHLLMATFYQPTRQRFKIVMEDAAFPSDTYAARTQLRLHGFDPDEGLVVVRPPEGQHIIPTEAFERVVREQGDEIALVLLGAVNYFTGQYFDWRRIARAAHAAGATVGLDLAHAAGNVPLALHDSDVDFAAWCSYKYLNSGPGSVAGAFVHERHASNVDLPRLGGWWGNDPKTRFRMHLEPKFKPVPSADAWQVSNPPILSMAAVRASLEIFDKVGMDALWQKTTQLVKYMDYQLAHAAEGAIECITPREVAQRGCQWSLLVRDNPREFQKRLHEAGIISDFREPNVIRIAPVPLYNSFHDIWRFGEVLQGAAQPPP